MKYTGVYSILGPQTVPSSAHFRLVFRSRHLRVNVIFSHIQHVRAKDPVGNVPPCRSTAPGTRGPLRGQRNATAGVPYSSQPGHGGWTSIMDDQQSMDLLARVQVGDERAAEELFGRYVDRLIGLARSRLSNRLAPRLDPEDVVQSAYRSFFVRARQGEYSLLRSGDLWRLLAAVTLHKLYRQVEHHSAKKRSFLRDRSLSGGSTLPDIELSHVARDPSPSEVVAAVEELERVMDGCDPLQRRMLQMRLQGYMIDEIATEVSRSERTVRRQLDKVKQQWEKRLADGSMS